MKLALIYDTKCPKLTPQAYSQTYLDMFLALIARFKEASLITADCCAKDIDADVIIFFDLHSSHHIRIDGIKEHPAIKYEYFNDPHQKEFNGTYKNGLKVHKLGSEQRCRRALDRGVHYIICPYSNGYYKYLHPHLNDNMLVWFPVAPANRTVNILLSDRRPEVLANGHLWQGENGFRPYKFRKWAHERDCVSVEPHTISSKTPGGKEYIDFLSGYAGALALCDVYAVPKYSEIPLAGCVAFVQHQYDYCQMGFRDGKSCIVVNKGNFVKRINDFKNNVSDYQDIADSGRKLIEEKWTASHFADYIFKHCKDNINGN